MWLREKRKSKDAAKNVPEQVEGWNLPAAEKVKARCGTNLGGKIEVGLRFFKWRS